MISVKDLEALDKNLSQIVRHLKSVSVCNNAAHDAPVDKRSLEKLRDETAASLEAFKKSIIEYLSE